MRTSIDPARRCLPISEWPKADQAAWSAAVETGDPMSLTRGIGASWKATTRLKYSRSYGRWLNFIVTRRGGRSGRPADRVTPAHIEIYVSELERQRLAPNTVRNRVVDVLAVMLAFDPLRDWSWLKSCVRQLERRASDSTPKLIPKILTSDAVEHAEKHLRRLGTPSTLREVLEFRDWLMLYVLATLPLRLHNFTRLSLGRHLKKSDGLTWLIDIDGAEMKTSRPFAGVFPPKVSQMIDHYLMAVRPKLEREKNDRLWLSYTGKPLTDCSVYQAIVGLTRREFGFAISPHQFRRIFATSLCMSDLDQIEGARAALGHSSRRTTRDHYARASSLAASRGHQALMAQLRRSR